MTGVTSDANSTPTPTGSAVSSLKETKSEKSYTVSDAVTTSAVMQELLLYTGAFSDEGGKKETKKAEAKEGESLSSSELATPSDQPLEQVDSDPDAGGRDSGQEQNSNYPEVTSSLNSSETTESSETQANVGYNQIGLGSGATTYAFTAATLDAAIEASKLNLLIEQSAIDISASSTRAQADMQRDAAHEKATEMRVQATGQIASGATTIGATGAGAGAGGLMAYKQSGATAAPKELQDNNIRQYEQTEMALDTLPREQTPNAERVQASEAAAIRLNSPEYTQQQRQLAQGYREDGIPEEARLTDEQTAYKQRVEQTILDNDVSTLSNGGRLEGAYVEKRTDAAQRALNQEQRDPNLANQRHQRQIESYTDPDLINDMTSLQNTGAFNERATPELRGHAQTARHDLLDQDVQNLSNNEALTGENQEARIEQAQIELNVERAPEQADWIFGDRRMRMAAAQADPTRIENMETLKNTGRLPADDQFDQFQATKLARDQDIQELKTTGKITNDADGTRTARALESCSDAERVEIRRLAETNKKTSTEKLSELQQQGAFLSQTTMQAISFVQTLGNGVGQIIQGEYGIAASEHAEKAGEKEAMATLYGSMAGQGQSILSETQKNQQSLQQLGSAALSAQQSVNKEIRG